MSFSKDPPLNSNKILSKSSNKLIIVNPSCNRKKLTADRPSWRAHKRYSSSPNLCKGGSSPKIEKNFFEYQTSSSRGRANRSVSCLSINVRNPDLPINSLTGPPVPPRKSKLGDKEQSDMKLRRTISESKMEKEKKIGERNLKTRSVHFYGNSDEANLEPISIIGRPAPSTNGGSSPNLANSADVGPADEYDIRSSIEDLPANPEVRKKVIVAQKPNKLFGNLKAKVKIGRKRNKYKSSDDEGFESPTKDDEIREPVEKVTPLKESEDMIKVDKNNANDIVNEENTVQAQSNIESKKEDNSIDFKKHKFFKLDIIIGSGKHLLAMDRGGTSDPYLKCIQGQEKLFQTRCVSKTVNPVWGETFEPIIENPFESLIFQIFDKDMVGSDDFMGEASLDLTTLELNQKHDIALDLGDADNEMLMKKNRKRKPLGKISFRITMTPLTKDQVNELFRAEKTGKGGKGKSWMAVIHLVLVQARSLTAMDSGESSDPYCKISLGKEKFKTKAISKSINPKWREGFDLYWYEDLDNILDISIFDKDIGSKDDFMGRVKVDLRGLTPEVTHNLWKEVENGDGQLNVLVTISGTSKGDSPSKWESQMVKMQSEWNERYQLPNTFHKMKDVGKLMVRVLKAQGLSSADIGGKSDPFAVFELVNDRVQTHTEYKTLSPIWQKVFQFDVKDIHDQLEVTVYDEDKDHKYEFLGKVKIPLLKIHNNEKKWYMLKDKKLRTSAKGNNPMILLEMFFVYNKVRASVRTFNPKQLKYEDKSDIKFKHSVFMRNVNRVKAATANFDPEIIIREIKAILDWKDKRKTIFSFIAFLLITYYIQLWMVTMALILPFIKNILILSVTGGWTFGEEEAEEEDEDDAGDSANKSDKEGEKKSLKEKMQAMQDITLMVQNGLGALAHVLESVGNVFNFSVPFLSWLAMFVFTVATLLLYYVPLRYIIMAWGVNKFTKKILRPKALNNNELADFISRVPDNEEMRDIRELPTPDELARKQNAKKKHVADNDVI